MTDRVDTGRRHFLTVATVATGAVGAAFAAVPFLASWKPSARAKALGAPVEVDISKLEPGAMLKVEWRGKAIYVVHRTPQMLAQLAGVVAAACATRSPRNRNSRRSPRTKPARSSPNTSCWSASARTWVAHRSTSSRRATSPSAPTGRAASSAPATVRSSTSRAASSRTCRRRLNLPVPPYQFVTDSRILIGAEKGNA